jgi:hypothetical protein
LILFCLDDAHDGLADAWGTTWRLHLVSRLLWYLFLFTKFCLLFYLFSIGTDPGKIFSYRLVFLQVADFNIKCLDISLTGMNGEWRGIQVSWECRLVSIGQLIFHPSWFNFTIASYWLYIYDK